MAKKGRAPGPRGPYKKKPKVLRPGEPGADIEDPDKLGSGGIRLRQHRLARGWTVEKLAFEAGLAQGTISGIENGEIGWSKDSLPKLAKALGTTIGALFDRDPRPGKGDEIWALLDHLEPGQKRRVLDFTKGMVSDD